jgi:hypothetical protein
MKIKVAEYLEKKEKSLSKEKYEKLLKDFEGIDKEQDIQYRYFAGTSEKATDEGDNGTPATIDIISTIDEDRVGDVMIPEGCDFKSYAKTPTVLFGHNYNSIPVGVSKWQKVDGQSIKSRTEYFNSEFAKDVYEASINGALANSIGFIPKEWVFEEQKEKYEETRAKYNIKSKPEYIYTKWHLLEYSKVPVPANPKAITIAIKSAKSQEMKDFLAVEIERQKKLEEEQAKTQGQGENKTEQENNGKDKKETGQEEKLKQEKTSPPTPAPEAKHTEGEAETNEGIKTAITLLKEVLAILKEKSKAETPKTSETEPKETPKPEKTLLLSDIQGLDMTQHPKPEIITEEKCKSIMTEMEKMFDSKISRITGK